MSAVLSPDREYEAEAARQLAADARGQKVAEPQTQVLGAVLMGEFAQCVKLRRDTEQRWLKDLRQNRGVYDPTELEKMVGRSTVFVRKTRVKVKTIDSRVADLLFPAGSEKNWDIGPTPKPRISPEQREQIVQQMMQAAQQQLVMQQQAMAQQAAQMQPPQGPQAAPPAGAFPPAGGPPGAMPGMPPPPDEETITNLVKEFVAKAGKKMETTISDQLVESAYKRVCIKAIHSGHLYGTGVIKGPLVEKKTRTRFVKKMVDDPRLKKGEDGQMYDAAGALVAEPKQVMQWVAESESFVVPFVEYVPLWRFYPDMTVTDLEDCQYVFERHFLSRARMFDLTKRKSFKKDKILAMLEGSPSGSRSQLEEFNQDLKDLGDRNTEGSILNGTYEVLERWGYITGKQLKECGYEVADGRLEEAFFTNIWMLHNGEVIKCALQPIDGTTWPYHLYYFDKDETSIFPEGLASVMRDDQAMLNAATRVMLDNAAITSGPQLEVNIDLLAKTEKADAIFPFKIWRRNGKQPSVAAIRPIEIPNHLEDLVKMAQLFEQNADEVTAIPRYMSGENATQGAAGTAAGMSMLMAAANIVIKDLVTAWDEGVTRPFIQALYHWNMKYNDDDSIKGDYDVKARGTASLIAKEVRARQLSEFRMSVSNPLDAPYIKRHKMLIQSAEAAELQDVVMTEDEFKAWQKSPEAQKQNEFQQKMQEAQLAELTAKAALAEANAKLSAAKVEELAEAMKKLAAETANTVAKTTETLVAAVYAALQAGGVATRDPFSAPAADEILKSVGFVDKTPSPGIDQLNTTPVQATDGQMQLMQKGQSFAQPMREPGNTTNEAPQVDQPNPDAPPESPAPDLRPQTGQVGVTGGIETEVIE